MIPAQSFTRPVPPQTLAAARSAVPAGTSASTSKAPGAISSTTQVQFGSLALLAMAGGVALVGGAGWALFKSERQAVQDRRFTRVRDRFMTEYRQIPTDNTAQRLKKLTEARDSQGEYQSELHRTVLLEIQKLPLETSEKIRWVQQFFNNPSLRIENNVRDVVGLLQEYRRAEEARQPSAQPPTPLQQPGDKSGLL